MLEISSEQVIYSFNPDNESVAEAKPGDEVKFITKDCFSNQIRSENDLFSAVDWDTINPATGPLDIVGAEVGDTLVVEIKDIKVADKGVMATVPELGAFGGQIDKTETKVIHIEDGMAIFNDKIKLPIDPMIGVIGVAPGEDDIPCGTPERHGGNMDTRLIKKGSKLYFPVRVAGGRLAMGDLHAVMGDGEVSLCGLEIPGEVIVKVELVKNKQSEWPILETPDYWYIIASGDDLDQAADLALKNMLEFLEDRISMSRNDLVSLMSVAGSLEISQVVDPLKTVRMGISKQALKNYNFTY